MGFHKSPSHLQRVRQKWGEGEAKAVMIQGTKIFKNCTCPAGRVTYNFHSSCKHMYLSFKSVCNKELIREKYVI